MLHKENELASLAGEELTRRAGWLGRDTLDPRYVSPEISHTEAFLPELLAEEKRIRELYGGKALGILYLESRAAELGYRVPAFELIPATVFDSFLSVNGLSREDFTPRDEPAAPSLPDWKSEARAEVARIGPDLPGAEVKEIYRKHRKGFLVENKAFRRSLKRARHRNSFQRTLEIFEKGAFSPESERILLDAFNSLRDRMQGTLIPLVLSSSSVMEDHRNYPFKGIYESKFLHSTGDLACDFEEFKAAVKFIFAHIFSPRARNYRVSQGLPDEDRMAIVAKHMVGEGDKYSYSPYISGVSCQQPYLPHAFFHFVNRGLNTTTVTGRWMYRFASLDDGNGGTSWTGTRQSLEVLHSQNTEYFASDGIRSARSWDTRVSLSPSAAEPYARNMDRVNRAIAEERGPGEMEWSVGDREYVMPYQWRHLPLPERVLHPVNLDVDPESIILAADSIVGHGEVTLPIIGFSDFKTLSGTLPHIFRQVHSYILIGEMKHFEKDVLGLAPAADAIQILLPGLRGFINVGDEPVPLAAHWAEPFSAGGILTVCIQKLSEQSKARLRDISTISYDDVFLTAPVRLAVDALKRKGLVHIPQSAEI